MFSSHQDEDLWILIAKVVSGNASEEEQVQLSAICKQYPEIHQVTLELQAFWNSSPDDDCPYPELSFEKLEKRLRLIPD